MRFCTPLCLAAAAVAQPAAPPAPIARLESNIQRVIHSVNATWGIYIKCLETGEEIAINADQQMDTTPSNCGFEFGASSEKTAATTLFKAPPRAKPRFLGLVARFSNPTEAPSGFLPGGVQNGHFGAATVASRVSTAL
jgi:hypothetical protein